MEKTVVVEEYYNLAGKINVNKVVNKGNIYFV
jgi:hypothetical protein